MINLFFYKCIHSNGRQEVAKQMLYLFLVITFSRGNIGKFESWENGEPAGERAYFRKDERNLKGEQKET